MVLKLRKSNDNIKNDKNEVKPPEDDKKNEVKPPEDDKKNGKTSEDDKKNEVNQSLINLSMCRWIKRC